MNGPLPSVKAIKKMLLAAAAAVVYFLPGHLAVFGLLAYVLVTAMASTTNTAKTRSTEARLNAHITATAPAVSLVANGGTVGGSLTVAGDHTVQGNSVANNNHTVFGSMGVHGGTTLVGDASCSSNWSVSGTSTVFGAEGVHGNINLLGAIGGNYAMPQGEPSTQANPPNGTGGAAAYAGSFYSGSGAANWANDITAKVNQIIGSLHNAGVYT